MNGSLHNSLLLPNNTWAIDHSRYTSLPVFVSLTTVSYRLHSVHQTIQTILHGSVLPDRIFLFVSDEPYLMDRGVQSLPDPLLALVASNQLYIMYVENIGPHRKLLPLLKRHYDDDVIIITMDDDMPYQPNNTAVESLLRGYLSSKGQAVVALRTRRIGFCDSYPHSILRYKHWSNMISNQSRCEMFLLPLGTGGVLYQPRFFHSVVFSPELLNLTATTDDMLFRLTTMVNEIPVCAQCSDMLELGGVVRSCGENDEGRGGQASGVRTQTTNLTTTANDNIALLEQRQLRERTLYRDNRRGLNDLSWSRAVRYLQQKGLLHLQQLIDKYYLEREKHCYEKPNHHRSVKKQCSLMNCRGHAHNINMPVLED